MRTAKTDQTGRMPRLIWVFAGRTLILLVLSCRGSYFFQADPVRLKEDVEASLKLSQDLLAEADQTDSDVKGMLSFWHLSLSRTKPAKWLVCIAMTDIRLGICPDWSESLLSAWRRFGSLATQKVHSKDWSDWADAQAYLSLGWAHRSSFCWICRAPTFCLLQNHFLMSVNVPLYRFQKFWYVHLTVSLNFICIEFSDWQMLLSFVIIKFWNFIQVTKLVTNKLWNIRW